MIELKNISKSFNGLKVLREINLTILDGEVFVLLGRSGAGKTVLLKLILGLLKPDKGQINVFDVDVANANYKQLRLLREKIGVVFQNNALFNFLSVGENVGFFLIEHKKLPLPQIQKIVCEKLKLVGLDGIEKLYPHQLSGGMCKLVAIARAITTDPKLLIYDEPTAGIDPATARTTCALIKDLQTKLHITTIIATHDLRLAADIATRICFLSDGKIAQLASKSDFFNHPVMEVKQFIEAYRLKI